MGTFFILYANSRLNFILTSPNMAYSYLIVISHIALQTSVIDIMNSAL